jgi:hypothetical protein
MLGVWPPQHTAQEVGEKPIALSPGNPIGSCITAVGNLIVLLNTPSDILLVPLGMVIAMIGTVYTCHTFRLGEADSTKRSKGPCFGCQL